MADNDKRILTWDEIEGHDAQKEILTRAVEHHRIPHALLFSGISGIGKRALAREYAKALNCTNRTEGHWAKPCERCVSCVKYNRNSHPDILEVEPDGKFIRIEQVRDVIRYCRSGPFESRCKVVLLESVDKMNRESANALLKTLEEPVAAVHIILITERPDALLETIRSRCQLLRFGSLELSNVVQIVENAAVFDDAIEATSSKDLFEVAARLSNGSPGRTLEILERGILSEREELFSALSEFSDNTIVSKLSAAEKWNNGERDDLIARLEVLRSLFRDLSVFGVTKDPNRLIHIDFLETYKKMLSLVTPLVAANYADKITDSLNLLDQNVNPQLIAENLLDLIGSQR